MQKDSKSSTIKKPKIFCRRKFFCGVILGLIMAVVCFMILDKAMVPLSSDSFCILCHEMDEAYETWQQSAHYTNPSGIKVTCVSCHLPPREQYASHLAEKAYVGIKDVYVHYFGKYDKTASRKHVVETLPNAWCVSCHDNLLAKASSRSVEIVHNEALNSGRFSGYGCVFCHDNLHRAKVMTPKPGGYEEAENYFCYVCHVNFEDEEFTVVHKNANVGCMDCHGDSDEHSADEDHITPPDIMFKKSDVNDSCMTAECHPKIDMEKEIGHRPFFAESDPQRKYCNDCHGMHNLTSRQRKWDKETRKLIWRDGHYIE